MPTIVIKTDAAPHTFAAMAKRLRAVDDYLVTEVSPAAASAPNAIGIVHWFGGGSTREFMLELASLWDLGARRFVLFAPGLAADDPGRPWARLQSLQQSALAALFAVCGSAEFDALLQTVAQVGSKSTTEWAVNRLHNAIAAFRLQDELLRVFGHNSKADLSNQFLAPARLLLEPDLYPPPKDATKAAEEWEATVANWRQLWSDFRIRTSDAAARPHFAPIGSELVALAAPIDRWLLEGDEPCQPSDLELMMAFLTFCRSSSGSSTEAEPAGAVAAASVPPLRSSAGEPSSACKVLVIDDHSHSWQPVFERLQRGLAEEDHNITFEFSVDASWVTRADRAEGELSRIRPGEYALIILDVFLGSVDGRTELTAMRHEMDRLPVVLWTTSRNDEISTQAAQASGILLKKTVTWHTLFEVVNLWARRGKVMGASSLPNPFFNHLIQSDNHRRLLRELNEWCLKQLDSFHALDGSYFRYFTDHGGRHIVKLLELLEQALRPFLGDKGGALLSRDADEREFEVLALYITVVCHELGMFPLSLGHEVENFSGQDRGQLDDVRTLHAPRGMVLIKDATRRFWSDDVGRDLGRFLHEQAYPSARHVSLADMVATLVGYHARFFKDVSSAGFLQWTSNTDRRLQSLNAELPAQLPAGVFRTTMSDLGRVFGRPESARLRERLQRQCALFRFVDAVDLSHSRNPALFLLQHSNRSCLNNREYLKRQLCLAADFDAGVFRVDMSGEPPEPATIRRIVTAVETFGLLKHEVRDEKQQQQTLQLAYAYLEDAALDFCRPWAIAFNRKASNEAVAENRSKLERSVLVLQKLLDAWVRAVWVVMEPDNKDHSREQPQEGFIQHLRDIGVIQPGDRLALGTEAARKLVASVTALSVAGEVLDEYEAIVAVHLTDDIQLGEFRWLGWNEAAGVLNRVSILGEDALKLYRNRPS
jgi:DNA-binding NarL/FixJ family response regulator